MQSRNDSLHRTVANSAALPPEGPFVSRTPSYLSKMPRTVASAFKTAETIQPLTVQPFLERRANMRSRRSP